MLQSLASSWRSLRDRRRVDLLDVIPAPSGPGDAGMVRSSQPAVAAGSEGRPGRSTHERQVDARTS
jgi:hypothetical protein